MPASICVVDPQSCFPSDPPLRTSRPRGLLYVVWWRDASRSGRDAGGIGGRSGRSEACVEGGIMVGRERRTLLRNWRGHAGSLRTKSRTSTMVLRLDNDGESQGTSSMAYKTRISCVPWGTSHRRKRCGQSKLKVAGWRRTNSPRATPELEAQSRIVIVTGSLDGLSWAGTEIEDMSECSPSNCRG